METREMDNTNSSTKVVTVPMPLPGNALAVDMVPGNALQLPFDPGSANASRAGSDLVFEVENGGSITINNFFAAGEGGELPALILPGGMEVSSASVFGEDRFDLSTAAGGDGNNTAESSGTGDYADDPGSLLNGIDRLGSLGTMYWDRTTEVPEEYTGPERPAGSFTLDGQTDLGGLIGFTDSVYEDGLPFQHMGDRGAFTPGQLLFTFVPSGTTVVDAIHISGFPAGTVLYLGDPNDPATPTITVTGPDQILDFTEKDFANGVYLVPPKNSDSDIVLSVEVDIHAKSSGLSTTIGGTVTVVVDAVADRPDLDGYGATADSSEHHTVHEAEDYAYDQGVNRVENNTQQGASSGGATVTVTVKATFDDYMDGSERHYMLVETHDHLELDVNSLPDGCTYVGTIVIDGVEYHQFEVDNGFLADNNGTAELPIHFTTTDNAAQNSGKDEQFDLKVGAYAEEEAGDKEIDLGNNTAHIVNDEGKDAGVSVDVVNRGLDVTVGWAYEGNDGSKHTSGSYNPNAGDFAGMDAGEGVAADSTGSNGAPITIRLSGNHEGFNEFITSVELQFDEGRGQLCVHGEPVTDGYAYTENGVTYTFSIGSDGKTTISISGETDNLDSLNLSFRPNPGYDDADVGMSYTVHVENGAGATAEYGGKTEIVVDSVADRAIHGNTTVEYGQTEDGDGKTAASPGDTVELAYTVRFPDTDGSEEHRFFIRVDGNNGSATHAYGNNLVSGERLAELNQLGGGFNPKGEYLELPIPHPSLFDGNGNYTDPATGLVVTYENGTYTYEGLNITITDNGNGNYTVQGVEVTLPDESTLKDGSSANGELNPNTGDTSMNFESKAWSHEQGGDTGSSNTNNEHDTNNNNAFTSGNGTVQIATPGGNAGDFTLSGNSGFENDQAHNNLAGSVNQDANGNDNTASGGVDLSITWNFADRNEYVTEIVIKVPLDRHGNPVGAIEYGGTVYSAEADGTIRIPVDASDSRNGFDKGDLTFIPKGNQSGTIDLDVSATIRDPDTGETKTVDVTSDDKKLTVDLDAVANRSGEVSGEGNYGSGKEAFAPEEGDTISFTLRTTFDDNDGSEQHFLLVAQKPHWNGAFDVGAYDLDGDGDKSPYFKIPVPTMPPKGFGSDYPGDAHHLSAREWQDLLDSDDGTITIQRDGYSITISLQQNGNGEYDPSLPWNVEAEISLTPPYLPENKPDSPYTIGTGSLSEERNIDQSTENRHENNNTAMRPGEDISFNVDRTEGIRVDAGFVYENNEQYEGPAYTDDHKMNGAISVTPSSPADAFYGDLEVRIPSGHGELFYKDAAGNVVKLEPGQSYEYTARGGVQGQLVVHEENGELTVTFRPNDPNAHYGGMDLEVGVKGDYSDKDINISVEGNLVNGNSGQQTPGVSGGGSVTTDAVAQNPDEVISDVAPDMDAETADGEGARVTLKARFDDVADGSETHYFLLEAKPGFSYTFTGADGKPCTIDVTGDWPTVVGPDGKTYFKIPASPDAKGNASLDVEIKVVEGAEEAIRKNGESDEATFNYGTMTEEENLTPDGEITYDNNIAFNDGNEFTIDVNLPGGDRPVDVDSAAENNTPNAHVGNDGESDEEYAKVHLPDDADRVLLNPERGTMVWWNEEAGEYQELPKDANGWYIVDNDKLGDVYFVLPKDYDDTDVSLDYKVEGGKHNGKEGQFDIVVDAVAQQGSVDNVTVHTGTDGNGDPYTHASGDEISLDVSLSGLVDPHGDGSVGGRTDYSVLVEAQPGWECLNEGAELIVIDGKSYFRVPVDPQDINADGTATVEVILKNPGGSGSQNLEVGVMVQDKPGDNGETTMDNNTSINFGDDPVTINTSEAEPNLKLSIGNGYEDNLGGYACIEVSNVGEHDVIDEMTFSMDSGKGVFVWGSGDTQKTLQSGDTVEEGNIRITVTEQGGRWVVTITSKDGSGITEDDVKNCLNKNLGAGVAEGNHSSEDLDIHWDYTVRDTQSGHTAGTGGSGTVVIDAVAHKPEVSEYEVDYGNSREAAQPGDDITVNAKVTFTHLEAEENYVLVQFAPGWEINGITLTGPDGTTIHFSPEELAGMDLFYPSGSASDGAYYKLPLEKDGIVIQPGTGEGGTYDVEVQVEVKVPDSGITGDVSGNVGVGGAAVDSYMDGETSLSNNVESGTANTDANDNGINIGVVDSTGLQAGQNGGVPGEGVGSMGITIEAVGGSNDVITRLTLTVSDPKAGEFWYDGVRMAYDENGVVSLPPAGNPGWVFDSSKLEFRPDANFGGEVNVKVDATVEDSKSGASKNGFTTDMVIDVEPEATAPADLTAQSGFDAEEGVWTLTLSASFADTDGSEEHFFLFSIPEGLVLDGSYPGLVPALGPNGETGYWKMPLDSADPNPSLALRFIPDADWDGTGEVTYHAGATEKGTGETAWADTPDSGNTASPFSSIDAPFEPAAISGAAYMPEHGDTQGAAASVMLDAEDDAFGQDALFLNFACFAEAHDSSAGVWDMEAMQQCGDIFAETMERSSLDAFLEQEPLVAGMGMDAGELLALGGESCSLTAAFAGENAFVETVDHDAAYTGDAAFCNAMLEYPPHTGSGGSDEALKELMGQGMA